MSFANGSTAVFPTKAFIPGNFTGVTDGPTAFQKFCAVPATKPAAPVTGAPAFRAGDPTNNTARLKGYPIAQVSSSEYVLDDPFISFPGRFLIAFSNHVSSCPFLSPSG